MHRRHRTAPGSLGPHIAPAHVLPQQVRRRELLSYFGMESARNLTAWLALCSDDLSSRISSVFNSFHGSTKGGNNDPNRRVSLGKIRSPCVWCHCSVFLHGEVPRGVRGSTEQRGRWPQRVLMACERGSRGLRQLNLTPAIYVSKETLLEMWHAVSHGAASHYGDEYTIEHEGALLHTGSECTAQAIFRASQTSANVRRKYNPVPD